MVSLPLTENQVVELVRQLPPRGKRRVLREINAERDRWWASAADRGEDDLRRLARERGRDWDALGEDAREALIDDLLHEPAP